MSRTKDHAGPFGRGRWTRVTHARRCPVCNGDSWCAVGETTAVCMRDTSGVARTTRDGVDYWVHPLDPTRPREFEPGPAVEANAPRADDDTLDAAYRCLLGALRLTDAHAADLRRRGLDEAQVALRGYRTLPLEGRSALAREVVARVGEAAARGVPGVCVREEGGRTWWSLGGSPGLLVPVRDACERVVALKVRRDGAGEGPRYTYVSSAAHGGPSARLAVHVPLLGDATACDEVRVTEGELKADVATALSDVPTVSIPGVGSWRAALPVVRALGARRVRVSLDADHRTNPEVGAACAALVRDLSAAGLEVAVERWDARCGKGIDDVLAGGRGGSVRVVCGAYAEGYAAWVAREAEAVRAARRAS
jgi:hypothetical protein